MRRVNEARDQLWSRGNNLDPLIHEYHLDAFPRVPRVARGIERDRWRAVRSARRALFRARHAGSANPLHYLSYSTFVAFARRARVRRSAERAGCVGRDLLSAA